MLLNNDNSVNTKILMLFNINIILLVVSMNIFNTTNISKLHLGRKLYQLLFI